MILNYTITPVCDEMAEKVAETANLYDFVGRIKHLLPATTALNEYLVYINIGSQVATLLKD